MIAMICTFVKLKNKQQQQQQQKAGMHCSVLKGIRLKRPRENAP